ncbi:MAG: bifunctional phosphoglucose/phosphomannose isomerase [Candidatus Hadarchaeales archaeon]
MMEEIGKVDKGGMLAELLRFPERCGEALSLEVRTGKRRVGKVVLAGMGGSAIAGDLLRDWLVPPFPFEVCRDYHLPRWVGRDTLVLAVSYSGNTEETLSCLSEALERGAEVVGISSGGRLEEKCLEEGIPHVKVPGGMMPRVALPFLLFPSFSVLRKKGLVEVGREELEEAWERLGRLRRRLAPGVKGNPAEEAAERLKGTLPFIYAPGGIAGVALRLKTQLNENSKVPAKVELLPELCHNEIVGLRSSPPFVSFILLRSGEENRRMEVRMEFLKELLRGRKVVEFRGEGRGRLARLLTLVYFGDFLSFYLAVKRGVDPTPVPEIEELKKRLSSL